VRGNPHAAFDVAGAGDVAWSRWCDTRRRKGEPTGNTNIDLNRRVSPRPYFLARRAPPRWRVGFSYRTSSWGRGSLRIVDRTHRALP
jgi:hypothetical protein